MMVLIVDDNEMFSYLLSRSLGSEAVSVSTSSLHEGLQLATEQLPDVIVLDGYLDGEPSFDMIPKFQAAAPGARVVVASGYANDEDMRRAFDRGACAYIDKADKAHLRSVITAAFSLGAAS